MKIRPSIDFPLPPQFCPRDALSSGEQSSQNCPDNHSTEFDKTQAFCVSTSQYLISIRDILAERMEKYEAKTTELDDIINKELLLEQSVSSLKNVITFLCIIAIILILLLLGIFIIINTPESSFIKKYITECTIFEVGTASYCMYFLIKSYNDLKDFSSRIAKLERKTKLDSE